MHCHWYTQRVGTFLKWSAGGAALGFGGGLLFGLLTGVLWLALKGDVDRPISNGSWFALAGVVAGLMVGVAAWWARAEETDATPAPPDTHEGTVDQRPRISRPSFAGRAGDSMLPRSGGR
jgi:hypothetical protein